MPPKNPKREARPIKPDQHLLQKEQVLELVGGVAYSTLWSWMKKFGFPFPIELGPRDGRTTKCAWLASEVYAWIAARPRRKIGGLREMQGRTGCKPKEVAHG